MATIFVVRAREILDSRGNPTVEVEIGLAWIPREEAPTFGDE